MLYLTDEARRFRNNEAGSQQSRSSASNIGQDYYIVPTLQQLLTLMRAHKSRPTGNDGCVFTQDSLEPRYSKIFTVVVVVVVSD